MKLKSLTDYVLELEKNWNYESTGLQNSIRKYKDCLFQIHNYASFLKQKIKLEMFVPCDEKGNVLKEPYEVYDDETEEFIDYIVDFHEAKNKVLFEDFYVKKDDDGILCLFHKNYEWYIAVVKPNFVWGRTNEFTIEDIVNYNPKLSLFVLNKNAVSRLTQACC